MYRLRSDKGYGPNAVSIIRELLNGRPVIAGVMFDTSTKRLATSGGSGRIGHFVICVGWDGRSRKMIVNDPGTSSGNRYQYAVDVFETSWATPGKVYIPVYR